MSKPPNAESWEQIQSIAGRGDRDELQAYVDEIGPSESFRALLRLAPEVREQVLTAGRDYVVDRKVQRRFHAGLASADKERHDFPGLYHDILGEAKRRRPIAAARRFILKHHCADEARTA